MLRTWLTFCISSILISTSYSQGVWGELFPNNQASKLRNTYNSISNNSFTEIEKSVLIECVKTLNNYTVSNLTRVNNEFQSKIINLIIATDSIKHYEKTDNPKWWINNFKQLNSILPLFVIGKKIENLDNPIDTITITLNETGKTLTVVVNNKVIKNYILSTGKQQLLSEQELRYLESDKLNEIIDAYRNDDFFNQNLTDAKVDQPVHNQTTNDLIADNNQSEISETSLNIEINHKSATHKEQNDSKSNSNHSNKSKQENNSQHQYLPPADLTKGIAYRIQIAAARTPLNSETLNNRYRGSREKKQFHEDGWIKYYVAEAESMTEARRILGEPEMPADAFIMSYKDGKKAPEYLRMSSYPKAITDLGPLTQGKKVLVVQIAADAKPLSYDYLKNIYNGNEPIYYINEGTWHRYSIGLFSSMSQAKNLRTTCGVNDAFVAGYKDGKRIMAGIPQNMQVPLTNHSVYYVVQIAASFKPLTKTQITDRYNGDNEILHIEENGYHKYMLGKYKTFQEALQQKIKCNVSDAFIKAYSNNQQVNLLKAKQITDNN